MKAEILISLISAVSLHAGLFCIGGGHRDLPHSATEIEIGLEAGDEAAATGVVDEPSSPVEPPTSETVEAQQVLPPEPPPEPIAPTPAPSEAPAPEPADHPPVTPEPAPVVQPQAIAKADPLPVKPVPNRSSTKVIKATASKKTGNAGKPSGLASSGGIGRGSNISSARYRFRAPLRYPASALAQHAGGTVVLVIEINDAGRAVDVVVRQSSGHRDLDASAVQCALASRYEPYRVNGQAEPCSVVAPFRFEPR